MISVIDFRTYSLEIEWLLTWFPIRPNAPIETPHIRGGTIRHKSNEVLFNTVGALGGKNRLGYTMGDGYGPPEQDSALAPNGLVTAFIVVGLDSSDLFEVDLEVHIPGTVRRKSYTLSSGTVTPFMLNVLARGDNPITANTAAVFQGVFNAGSRRGLFDIFTRRIGP